MTAQATRTIRRIQSAVGEMESLVEAFLIMAREGDVGLPDEDFVVNEVIHDEIEKMRPLLAHKPVELRLDEHAAFALHAPPRVFAVLFGNLLRNACHYTDAGSVTVRVLPESVVIEDTGIGHEPRGTRARVRSLLPRRPAARRRPRHRPEHRAARVRAFWLAGDDGKRGRQGHARDGSFPKAQALDN